MAGKHKVVAEEELTVKTQSRAPFAGLVLQNPTPTTTTTHTPLEVTPGDLRGCPRGLDVGWSGLAR